MRSFWGLTADSSQTNGNTSWWEDGEVLDANSTVSIRDNANHKGVIHCPPLCRRRSEIQKPFPTFVPLSV